METKKFLVQSQFMGCSRDLPNIFYRASCYSLLSGDIFPCYLKPKKQVRVIHIFKLNIRIGSSDVHYTVLMD